MSQPHNVLVVAFPAHGHLNPTLQFAKRLVSHGVRVTYMTTLSAINRLTKGGLSIEGLFFAPITDSNINLEDDIEKYAYWLEQVGSLALRELLSSSTKMFAHIVYAILMPWVPGVAREFQIPSTFLWVQPAGVWSIYRHYFEDRDDGIIRKNIEDPSFAYELPGLPVILKGHELPSFLHPLAPYHSSLSLIRRHFIDNEGSKPRVLINTFDALESKALQAIENYKLVGVGPLVPFGGDAISNVTKDNQYFKWLNSQPEGSVIYVSFGSMIVSENPQKEEIARGLLAAGFSFLWVIRDIGEEEKEDGNNKLSCKEELERQGMIVPWCSQVEVLSHPSVGCFLSHCGWNSTLESLASGVPMVAFPKWSDQGTNAKHVQDVWKTGVRVTKNEKGIVERHEIKRCLELVMGSEEMRQNAKKWKDLVKEAVNEGGTSDNNLKAFVDDIGKTN